MYCAEASLSEICYIQLFGVAKIWIIILVLFSALIKAFEMVEHRGKIAGVGPGDILMITTPELG